MLKRNFLVIGSNSFSGSHFVKKALSSGYEVMGISRSEEPSTAFLPYKWPNDKDNVCISFGVTIVCHFDPSESIKKHLIKKYQKKIIIEEGVFIGPNSTIMPGVILRKNSFIMAGTIVTKSTRENSIVFGNPQKEKKLLSRNFISKINSQNKKFFFNI